MKYPSYLETQIEAYHNKQANIFAKQCHDLCEFIYNADLKNVIAPNGLIGVSVPTDLLREIAQDYEANFKNAFEKFRKEHHRDELLFLVSFDHAFEQIIDNVIDIFNDLERSPSMLGDKFEIEMVISVIRDFEFARNTDVSIL